MTLLLAALLGVAGTQPERVTWTVDGVEREGLVCAPSAKGDAKPPLVFGFHGHGGSMQNAARSFGFHGLWPEAAVVYLQGLPTPGRLTDPEGKKPGWQHAVGEQGDRDLKLFDVVLAWMKEKHGIDENRVYSSGHSNGGGFTYLLWGARPGLFAAIGPSAAVGLRAARDAKPCPLIHIGGKKDPLVGFDMQARGVEAVRTTNACEETGKPWAPGCTIWTSSKSAPVVFYVHEGDHKYPAEAPALIVRFFKEQVRTRD